VLVLGVSARGVIGIAILVAYFAGGRVCAGAIVGLLLVLAWVAKVVLTEVAQGNHDQMSVQTLRQHAPSALL